MASCEGEEQVQVKGNRLAVYKRMKQTVTSWSIGTTALKKLEVGGDGCTKCQCAQSHLPCTIVIDGEFLLPMLLSCYKSKILKFNGYCLK